MWLTIVEALLLATVAVLAAWSGFASAKWSTHSSLQLAKASALQDGGQPSPPLPGRRPEEFRLTDVQRVVFTAYVAHNKTAMRVAENRFRPVFRFCLRSPGLHLHLTFTNPNAPKGPTYMPQYKAAGTGRRQRARRPGRQLLRPR